MHLLPNGKVLMWDPQTEGGTNTWVLDPSMDYWRVKIPPARFNSP